MIQHYIMFIHTHWKLLALSSQLANFERGTAFRRHLLSHQVHVQYCALTLKQKQHGVQVVQSQIRMSSGHFYTQTT